MAFEQLSAATAKMAEEVAKSRTLAGGVATLIDTLKANTNAAVAKALAEDDAADQGSIDAATAAIDASFAEAVAANEVLAKALTDNTPAASKG